MAKAVVFDLGKVLLDFDYHIAARALAQHAAMSPEDLFKFMLGTPLLERYETGLVTSDQFYKEVCAATGYGKDIAAFRDCFGDIFREIPEMVRLHASIRDRGIPTFVFSNTNEIAVMHIRRNFPFFKNFDGYILSYEHGAMKPDSRLYEVVERQTGLPASTLLYIDDRPENIATAEQRGWQVILQESPAITWAGTRRAGVIA